MEHNPIFEFFIPVKQIVNELVPAQSEILVRLFLDIERNQGPVLVQRQAKHAPDFCGMDKRGLFEWPDTKGAEFGSQGLLFVSLTPLGRQVALWCAHQAVVHLVVRNGVIHDKKNRPST